MSVLDEAKEMAKKGFDETIKVIKDGKHPMDAAKSVKDHGEKMQRNKK